jgi:LysR family transcriptional regulator, glycine cleavage system transcriptional activator
MLATPAARAFAAEISLSFDRVISAAEACGRLDARRILRVSAPTSFAMRWLIPRLDRFHAARPDVEVAVTTAMTLHDELRGGFDIAIRRGSAHQDSWPQHRAVAFLDEVDTLIVSPELFERQPIRELKDIAAHVLLSTETRPGDWTEWLEQAGLQPAAGQRRRVFDHFFVTRQAAADGLGLAIGPLPELRIDIEQGNLLTPFETITVVRKGHVALTPAYADKTPSLTSFIEWLVAEGKQSSSTSGHTSV